VWLVCLGFLKGGAILADDPKPELVYFLSGDVLRRGCVYKPPGKGPFPAIIYNQATTKPSIEMGDTAPFLTLAKLYTQRGYVLFLPGRRLADGSFAEKKDGTTTTQNQLVMDALKFHERDLEAAIAWFKAQSYVDEKRVFVSGHSSGALNSLLLAEKELGIRGVIAFSPAAKVWGENPLLREAMTNAVRNGPELTKKGKPNRSKIFALVGTNPAEGNAFAFNGVDLWSKDVFNFIDEVVKE
jgi:carboxymethylenebutenolidase